MSAAPVIAALLLAVFVSPSAAAWRPPVTGALTRPFAVTTNPFEAGQHRGIDLDAAPGAPVRAPCAGRVLVAGRVGTSGGVVTLRCGGWRVTHLPLATITVHAGTSIARGARLGTVGRGSAHAGLHLGVRREGERFGYVDPLRFLTPTPHHTSSTPRPRTSRPPRLPATAACRDPSRRAGTDAARRTGTDAARAVAGVARAGARARRRGRAVARRDQDSNPAPHPGDG